MNFRTIAVRCVQLAGIGLIVCAGLLSQAPPPSVRPGVDQRQEGFEAMLQKSFPDFRARLATARDSDRVRWMLASALARTGKLGPAQDVMDRCSEPVLRKDSLGPLILEALRTNPDKARAAAYHVADPMMQAETFAFLAVDRAVDEPDRVVINVNQAFAQLDNWEQMFKTSASPGDGVAANK